MLKVCVCTIQVYWWRCWTGGIHRLIFLNFLFICQLSTYETYQYTIIHIFPLRPNGGKKIKQIVKAKKEQKRKKSGKKEKEKSEGEKGKEKRGKGRRKGGRGREKEGKVAKKEEREAKKEEREEKKVGREE